VNDFLRRILIGLVAGLAAGTVIIGIGGRLAMRLITILGGLPGGYSWDGTLEVVMFGLITGIISGVVFGTVERYAFSNRMLTGLVYGALVFGSLVVIPIDAKGAASGFPDLQAAIYLIFGSVLLVYGIALATMFSWCTQRLDFIRKLPEIKGKGLQKILKGKKII